MSHIAHSERGTGTPLILVHGYCESREIWDRFSQKLSSSFRVLMPDLPGFGESPLLSRSFTIAEIGNALLGWMHNQNMERPVMVGHSLGGYIALAMVNAEPDSFSGFGLFHSTAYADTDDKRENRNRVIDFVKKNGSAPFVETFVPGLFHQKNHAMVKDVYRIVGQARPESIIAYAAAMRDRPSHLGLLESYRRPILIVAGEHDSIIPFDQSSAESQMIRFPFFSALPDSGHMGMFENEPESIKIVNDFAKLAVEFSPT